MAELVPAQFDVLVRRMHSEPASRDMLFGLARRYWYAPAADGPDMTVLFHGRSAGNPLGPAAGPHTQMAQNLLTSYAAGSRILELKTVQVRDKLDIPRPCIDVANIGFNVEWSQELRVEESLREYVAGSMLIHMFRHGAWLEGRPLAGSAGDVILDISVGYDLAGIKTPKVRGFLEGMKDASRIVAELRDAIPAEHGWAKDLDFPTCLSGSVTVSTFHGCPPGEIEGICEHLIDAYGFDVVVKMNPTMLGREQLDHLLHDVLGYSELEVNPKAYEAGLEFDEGVDLSRRLAAFAAARGRHFGCKFTNTLEVVNHRDFFTPENEVMYMSGQPLHVVALTLADRFRRAVGPGLTVTFSGGIDKANFGDMTACGFAPVTTSTDILRPGGYGRLPLYLREMAKTMKKVGADDLDAFILNRYGQADEARRLAEEASKSGGNCVDPARWAGWLNTSVAARESAEDVRYHAAQNRKAPRRVDSFLETFDCLTCDKCVPVCPNAANFTYPTPRVESECRDIVVQPDGTWREGERRAFRIEKESQIACYADFCNECGNCDTFCPEYGGPYIQKPSVYGSIDSYERAAPRDGFIVGGDTRRGWIQGRIKGVEYRLEIDADAGECRFRDAAIDAAFSASDDALSRVAARASEESTHTIDMRVYHTLRHLHAGLVSLDDQRQGKYVQLGLPQDDR